jgi:hypothetical protein
VLGRVPLYYELKLIGLLWLALPQTRGALKLYQDHKDKLDLLYKQAIEQLDKIQAVTIKPKPSRPCIRLWPLPCGPCCSLLRCMAPIAPGCGAVISPLFPCVCASAQSSAKKPDEGKSQKPDEGKSQ